MRDTFRDSMLLMGDHEFPRAPWKDVRSLALGQGGGHTEEGILEPEGRLETRTWSGEFLMVIEVEKTVSVKIFPWDFLGNARESFGITDAPRPPNGPIIPT